MNAFRRSPSSDSVNNAKAINQKSETPFLPYAGKGIRHIYVRELGFDVSFADTATHIDYFGTRILNRLHRNTRQWVIRDNLYIKEKTKLNPYIIADNERYLRSLEYIQDARIVVRPVAGEKDSVDIFVFTKDLFSITAEVNDLSTDVFKIKLTEANISGTAQKIQVTTLVQSARNPNFGYNILYAKNNLKNTFLNAAINISTISTDLSGAAKDEHRWSFYIAAAVGISIFALCRCNKCRKF